MIHIKQGAVFAHSKDSVNSYLIALNSCCIRNDPGLWFEKLA